MLAPTLIVHIVRGGQNIVIKDFLIDLLTMRLNLVDFEFEFSNIYSRLVELFYIRTKV